MKKVADLAVANCAHDLSANTKTVVLRQCWSVWFDVDGCAPADGHVVACATKELAHMVLVVLSRDGKTGEIIISGRKKVLLDPSYAVEGFSYACQYVVRQDWRQDDEIIRSLTDLIKTKHAIGTNSEWEDTDLPDGVFVSSRPTDRDDDDEE